MKKGIIVKHWMYGDSMLEMSLLKVIKSGENGREKKKKKTLHKPSQGIDILKRGSEIARKTTICSH